MDALELGQLGVAQDRAVVRLGRDVRIDPAELTGGLQTAEDIVDGCRRGHRLDLIGQTLAERGEELLAGLHVGTVADRAVPRGTIQLMLSGSTPFPSSQMQASIPVLPAADDDELVDGVGNTRQVVQRHTRDSWGNGVCRRCGRRNGHPGIGRIDEATSVHLMSLS